MVLKVNMRSYEVISREYERIMRSYEGERSPSRGRVARARRLRSPFRLELPSSLKFAQPRLVAVRRERTLHQDEQ